MRLRTRIPLTPMAIMAFLYGLFIMLSGCAKQFPDADAAIRLSVDSISPSSGSAGTAVLIYGKGFSAVPSGNRIYFNGVPAVQDSIASYKVLRAFAPAGGSTGPVSVATQHDSAAGPLFSYNARPVISNIVYNGTFIIYGSNFDAQGSVVSIGGETETGFTYALVSGEQTLSKLRYTPAAGLDNPAPVFVTAKGIASNSYFYLFNPLVLSFGASRTPTGNPIMVYGALFGSRSVPSTLRMFIYGSGQQKIYLSPDPVVVSWATALIEVNMPDYFPSPVSIPPPTYLEVSVGSRSSFLQYSN